MEASPRFVGLFFLAVCIVASSWSFRWLAPWSFLNACCHFCNFSNLLSLPCFSPHSQSALCLAFLGFLALQMHGFFFTGSHRVSRGVESYCWEYWSVFSMCNLAFVFGFVNLWPSEILLLDFPLWYSIFALLRSLLFRRSPYVDLNSFDNILTKYVKHDNIHVGSVPERHFITK